MKSFDFSKYFGKDYYEKEGGYRINGHFVTNPGRYGHYHWSHKSLQKRLEMQYNLLMENITADCKKILVVGCGKGFEPLFFRQRGLDAYGIDISYYAINHAHPKIKGFVFREDICSTERFKEDEFDVVASFNVLSLVDKTKRKDMAERVSCFASKFLVLKFGVAGDRIPKRIKPDGYDGAPIYLEPLEYWVALFEGFGKFELRYSKIVSKNCIALMQFGRKK